MNESRNADHAALVLRLALGVMFLSHGLLKVLVFTPEGTAGYLVSIGLPGLLAWPTIAAEIGGGLLLLLGVQTRLVAGALVPLLAGTIVFAHGGNGWLFSAPGGGWEYPAFLIAASIAQVLLGDGSLALRLPGRAGAGIATAAAPASRA